MPNTDIGQIEDVLQNGKGYTMTTKPRSRTQKRKDGSIDRILPDGRLERTLADGTPIREPTDEEWQKMEDKAVRELAGTPNANEVAELRKEKIDLERERLNLKHERDTKAEAMVTANQSENNAVLLNALSSEQCDMWKKHRMGHDQLKEILDFEIAELNKKLNVKRERLDEVKEILDRYDRFAYRTERADAEVKLPPCEVCGWIHNPDFSVMVNPNAAGKKLGAKDNPITLTGILPQIIEAVHKAHEEGLPRLATTKLKGLCAAYGEHPSKAFHDLHKKQEYRALLLTNQPRGFISIRRPATRKEARKKT